MSAVTRKVEIDELTAIELESRAADEGTTVSNLIARLVQTDREAFELSPEQIAELDQQRLELEAGAPTIPHEEVAAWLRTWGTPDFKPWPDR